MNINEGVGATHAKHLKAAVVAHEADLGIALDGDGDRLLMVDRDGRAFDGDQLLYVIAMDYRRRKALDGRRGRHVDDQPRSRAARWRAKASRSIAPRSATATCWRS